LFASDMDGQTNGMVAHESEIQVTLKLHTSCPSKPKVHALIRSSKGPFAEM
jgi:hypothetical protein